MSWLSSFLGNKPTPYAPQLTQTAQQAGQTAQSEQALGTQLVQPLLTGKLPPGLQAQVDLTTNDALAEVLNRQRRAAGPGLPARPGLVGEHLLQRLLHP